jgi:hypothetical protein
MKWVAWNFKNKIVHRSGILYYGPLVSIGKWCNMAKFSSSSFFLEQSNNKEKPTKALLKHCMLLSGKTSLRDLEIGAANLPNIV